MADNLKTIECPACHKEMAKIYVSSENINVDVCVDGCGGIYFDNREFKKFDEPKENIDEILNSLKDKTFIEVDETETRICPCCGSNMVKHFSGIKIEVTIDSCYNCGGVFLDRGELEKIRAEYNTEKERSKDVVDFVNSIIGKEIDDMIETNAKLHQKRSRLKKFYDKLFFNID